MSWCPVKWKAWISGYLGAWLELEKLPRSQRLWDGQQQMPRKEQKPHFELCGHFSSFVLLMPSIDYLGSWPSYYPWYLLVKLNPSEKKSLPGFAGTFRSDRNTPQSALWKSLVPLSSPVFLIVAVVVYTTPPPPSCCTLLALDWNSHGIPVSR